MEGTVSAGKQSKGPQHPPVNSLAERGACMPRGWLNVWYEVIEGVCSVRSTESRVCAKEKKRALHVC
jgi:hypothetical protein